MTKSYPLYTIRDIKLNSFDAPFQSENDATAKRMFSRLLKHIPLMNENPQDFTMHSCGSFLTHNGEVKPTPIQYICSGLDLVNNQPRDKTNAELQKAKVSNDTPIQPSSQS